MKAIALLFLTLCTFSYAAPINALMTPHSVNATLELIFHIEFPQEFSVKRNISFDLHVSLSEYLQRPFSASKVLVHWLGIGSEGSCCGITIDLGDSKFQYTTSIWAKSFIIKGLTRRDKCQALLEPKNLTEVAESTSLVSHEVPAAHFMSTKEVKFRRNETVALSNFTINMKNPDCKPVIKSVKVEGL
eukprot:TRINITY_DN6642_c0_g2_i1.p2 TRINITY_DN6642_c0_g2~~TRINITY_DN6642_c0_g2_i1.p2  ORF type:complete len:188 (+),score=12.91 TRINITY_DN6642_c0_g2_i1:91-654(+)